MATTIRQAREKSLQFARITVGGQSYGIRNIHHQRWSAQSSPVRPQGSIDKDQR